jgi:hypothetical protein
VREPGATVLDQRALGAGRTARLELDALHGRMGWQHRIAFSGVNVDSAARNWAEPLGALSQKEILRRLFGRAKSAFDADVMPGEIHGSIR